MRADQFETAAGHRRVEIAKVKGSRFIAEIFPVTSEDEIDPHLDAVRRTYHDATHHCFAYRLGPDGGRFRSSDDGEPSGSAGAPILRKIESSGLTDVLVVVIRYYGGTKLGAGGLARAYGAAAEDVLAQTDRSTRTQYRLLKLEFFYDDTSPAMRLIERFGAVIVASSYGEGTTLEVKVPASQVEAFIRDFVDDLGGRGSASAL